ncbi:acyl-CoA carboxylase subunit epsilon [Nocardioides sp. GCM10027113]|uniref:acyl-CoA carboxylase subunit epsilon n=1 Tax=unclassified Nocardioides TaxID=2615069 RepID=UPI003605D8AD
MSGGSEGDGTAAEPVETKPLLRVVNGDATPEEVAALVAVLSSLGGGGEPPARRPVSEWSAHHRKVRRTLPHGPGGWRSSALPR